MSLVWTHDARSKSRRPLGTTVVGDGRGTFLHRDGTITGFVTAVTNSAMALSFTTSVSGANVTLGFSSSIANGR